ncbi:MAG: TAXI family TRAP transporter solute-binding subunit, partial [Pseudomonadota bacterium]
VLGPTTLLCVAGFVIAYQFVDPAPPQSFAIATGSPSGAYYSFARQYQKRLAQERVNLDVISTEGTINNLTLLRDPTSGVSAALVQGGVEPPAASGEDSLVSLGSVFFEPLWLFHRREIALSKISDLRGLRVSVGSSGSGTQSLARTILAANQLGAEQVVLRELNGASASDQLIAGELDAGFFVASPESAIVRSLLASGELALFSFARADAYGRLYPFLSSVTLPRGVIDLVEDIPRTDVQLLATTANLVVRDDLHPALVDLLMQALQDSHGGGGIFEDAKQFPAPTLLALPLSEEAARFYRSGPPFLQRYLPFWAATLLDRIKVMIVPLFALLIPMIKIAPPVYRWRVRSRIYRWYKDLQQVEADARRATTEDIAPFLRIVDGITAEVTQEQAPPAYADELYNLRFHLERVRAELIANQAAVQSGD